MTATRVLSAFLFLLTSDGMAQELCDSSRDSNQYEYTGIASGRAWVIDPHRNIVTFGGHGGHFVPVDDERFSGLIGEFSFSFVVPKLRPVSSWAAEWEYNRTEFRVGRAYALELLGRLVPVREILSKQKVGEVVFLFSEQRGLVAMHFKVDGKQSDIYILTDGCGYLSGSTRVDSEAGGH